MTVYELLHKTSMDKIISVIKTRTNSADFGEMEVFIKHILKLDPVINDNSDLVVTDFYESLKTGGLFEYRDVYAFNKNTPNERIDLYSIPLEIVIGLSIDKSCLINIRSEELLADILEELK